MGTVFSHIIQTRFSGSFEDVATDSLAYILNSSDQARAGVMRLLRAVEPGIPDLFFRTQQTAGSTRPDMWGYTGTEVHAYVESKFWAGLTNNQPVSYLRQLAVHAQPTILLVVVPGGREQMMITELTRRLLADGVTFDEQSRPAMGVVWYVKTEWGPWLAMTSWPRLLEILEASVKNDTSAKNDLLQLRSLSEAADIDAFRYISAEECTNQRIPALILQLGHLVRSSMQRAARLRILHANAGSDAVGREFSGRYAWITEKGKVELWFGIHFAYWKAYGRSPLWVQFNPNSNGRASEVKPLLEAWGAERGGLISVPGGYLVCPIDVDTGVDMDQISDSIVRQLKEIALALSPIPVRSSSAAG